MPINYTVAYARTQALWDLGGRGQPHGGHED